MHGRRFAGEERGGNMHDEDGIDLGRLLQHRERLTKTAGIRVADNVHRIGVRPVGGQHPVQGVYGLRRRRRKLAPVSDDRIGGKHTGSAAVGEDRQSLAVRRPL